MTGPQSSYNAVETLLLTCEDMLKEYEHLAQSGSAILSKVDGAIGLYWQYKYHYSGANIGDIIEYHDRDIRWWEKMIAWSNGWQVSTDRVQHPERDDAITKLKATQGTVTDADTKFDYDAESIRHTVSSVATFLAGWLTAYQDFAAITFPEVPEDIRTPSTTTWDSPLAVDRYARNMGLQFEAHETTESIVADLMDRCSKFLTQLKTSLVEFAKLVEQQEEYYASFVTSDWVPEKLSWRSLMDIIGDIGGKVVEYRRQQNAKATAMIEVMLDAVDTILQTEVVLGRIDSMARAGEPGWPLPNDMGISGGGSPSGDLLTFNAQYFKDHIAIWQELGSQISPIAADAGSIPVIQRMFYRWPAFGSTTASALNSLGDELATKALNRASTAMGQMSTKLDATIRNYLAAEAENEATARELEAILDGS